MVNLQRESSQTDSGDVLAYIWNFIPWLHFSMSRMPFKKYTSDLHISLFLIPDKLNDGPDLPWTYVSLAKPLDYTISGSLFIN
jgi:hypothetical protein